MAIKKTKFVGGILVGVGCFFGLLAMASLVGGLYRVNWQVTEFLRQYLVASGMVKPIHTMVDFYSHIKGVEYLICVVFFVAFPLFYQYVDKKKIHSSDSTKTNTIKVPIV